MSRYKTLLRLVAVVQLFVFTFDVSLAAEAWKFGVIPDTQWKNREEGYRGVAVHIIDAVNEEMIRRKVDIVIHVGDVTDYATQPAFDLAARHFKTLTDAGIKFYPIRGNHDVLGGVITAEQFAKAFPDLPGTPGGVGSSPDLPGMAGLTYSFVHKNARFFMLDIFSVKGRNGERIEYKPSDFQPWIDTELKKKDFEQVFIVSHKNLIGQRHKDNLFSLRTPNGHPEMQNRFFKSFQNAGARFYLSGHDHMYYRSRIRSMDRQSELVQIICGSCSSVFYEPKEPFSLRDIPQAQETGRVGFMIFTIEGDKVTGEYYSTEPFGDIPAKPNWDLRERFGYSGGGKYFEEQNVPMKDFLRHKLIP